MRAHYATPLIYSRSLSSTDCMSEGHVPLQFMMSRGPSLEYLVASIVSTSNNALPILVRLDDLTL